MKGFKRCEKGHMYKDNLDVCPYCPKGNSQLDDKTEIAGSSEKFDKTEIAWHKINNTYGVSRLVTFNSTLKSIPSIFIDNLMMRSDFSGKLLPERKFRIGTQVKVTRGPFADFIANIEKYETDQRIWVLIDLMGRKTKIQIPLDTLQTSD